jgi:N-acetylneuraminate synthase
MSVYLIAEIGANHCGRMDIAKALIDMAADCEVDCVKGQMRDIEGHPEWREKPYSGPHSYGSTYYEHRKALEFTVEQHVELRDYAALYGLDYTVSVWDVPSAEAWLATEPDWVKVPSACANDKAMLRVLADSAAKVILSTGMMAPVEIDEAVRIFVEPTLLVCTSCYPCNNEDARLARIGAMREAYPGCKVGISGHWTGIQLDAAAVALGAEVIERHVTLDRTWKGTDHAASLEPGGVRKWVRDVRIVERSIGTPELGVLPGELRPRAKLGRGWRVGGHDVDPEMLARIMEQAR